MRSNCACGCRNTAAQTKRNDQTMRELMSNVVSNNGDDAWPSNATRSDVSGSVDFQEDRRGDSSEMQKHAQYCTSGIAIGDGKVQDENNYYRPSYMFHWLKSIGRTISEAYTAFEEYHGKISYRETGLEKPKPMPQDDSGSELLRMSDYDEFGFPPNNGQDGCTTSEAQETSSQEYVRPEGNKDQPIGSDHNRATGPTEHSNYTNVMFDNHDAGTRDDRRGESHVVCSNHRGALNQGGKGCEVEKVCRPTNQPYKINGWSSDDDCEGKGMLVGCMTSGVNRGTKARLVYDESDDEGAEMVCNMIGQSWETLPFSIIIDSGACASVMPTIWCNHVPIQDTPQSKAGDYYRAANGNNIYHEGERIISMMTQEGSFRDMKFTVCDVSKALRSVSQMCKIGHREVFKPPWSPQGSYIEHVNIGSGGRGGCGGRVQGVLAMKKWPVRTMLYVPSSLRTAWARRPHESTTPFTM